MKIVIASVFMVFLLVSLGAGPEFPQSPVMKSLHGQFSDQHFKVFSRSLIKTASNLGQKFDVGGGGQGEILENIREAEIFEIRREGPLDCNELKLDLEKILTSDQFDLLLNLSGPIGDIELYGKADASTARQLIAFTMDSVHFRTIEIKGALDMKELMRLGPSGLTDLFKNITSK